MNNAELAHRLEKAVAALENLKPLSQALDVIALNTLIDATYGALRAETINEWHQLRTAEDIARRRYAEEDKADEHSQDTKEAAEKLREACDAVYQYEKKHPLISRLFAIAGQFKERRYY